MRLFFLETRLPQVGMEIDKAWGDNLPRSIDGFIIAFWGLTRTDPRNLTIGYGDVEFSVDPLRRVDQASAYDQKIFHSSPCLPERRYRIAMRMATPLLTCSLITDLSP